MFINFINAAGTQQTGSYSFYPINYPTITNQYQIDGDVISQSSSPNFSQSLANNIYKFESNGLATNDWYISASNNNVYSVVSGSAISSSICQVYFSLIKSDLSIDSNTLVTITPVQKNTIYINGGSSSMVYNDTLSFYTDINGNLTASLLSQPYKVVYQGLVKNTTFKIYPTASCNVNQCEVTGFNISNTITTQNQSVYGYTAKTSDLRYILSGSIGSSVSSSYASSSSFALNSLSALSASYASYASYATNALSSSYSPNTLPFVTDNSGNVGINAAGARYSLEVGGAIGNVQNNFFFNSGYESDINANYNTWVNGQGGTNNGKFGVGTNNPAFTLDVNGSIGNNSSANFFVNDSTTPDIFGAYNSWVNAYGNYFGVGTNQPSYTLDVNGDINFSGQLLNNGSPFSGGGGDLTGTSLTITSQGPFPISINSTVPTSYGQTDINIGNGVGGVIFGVRDSGQAFVQSAIGDTRFEVGGGSLGNLSGSKGYYSTNVTSPNFIGLASSASFVNTASYSNKSLSSSFANQAVSSSYVTASFVSATTIFQMPYSSSGHTFITSSNLYTGSSYYFNSGSTNLQYIYTGIRWCSMSLA